MSMTRRAFLGLLGSSLVIRPTFEEFRSVLSPVVPMWGRMHDFLLVSDADEDGWLALTRVASGIDLLRYPIGARGTFRWWAEPGHEIILPQGIASLSIECPPFSDWQAVWQDALGRTWANTSRSAVPIPMELP